MRIIEQSHEILHMDGLDRIERAVEAGLDELAALCRDLGLNLKTNAKGDPALLTDELAWALAGEA